MRAVREHLTDDDELGLVGFGQSNRRPWGHRDKEGFVEAPHLRLRPAGTDLTIIALVGVFSRTHGAVSTQSIVTVGEALVANDWINGELRLVQHEHGDSTTSQLRRGHAKVLGNAGVATSTVTFDTTANTVYWPNHGRKNGSQVAFTTTGVMPDISDKLVYWIVNAAKHTFEISESPGGPAIDLSPGYSGTHTATTRAYLWVEWVSEFQAPDAAAGPGEGGGE